MPKSKKPWDDPALAPPDLPPKFDPNKNTEAEAAPETPPPTTSPPTAEDEAKRKKGWLKKIEDAGWWGTKPGRGGKKKVAKRRLKQRKYDSKKGAY